MVLDGEGWPREPPPSMEATTMEQLDKGRPQRAASRTEFPKLLAQYQDRAMAYALAKGQGKPGSELRTHALKCYGWSCVLADLYSEQAPERAGWEALAKRWGKTADYWGKGGGDSLGTFSSPLAPGQDATTATPGRAAQTAGTLEVPSAVAGATVTTTASRAASKPASRSNPKEGGARKS